jgi:hypothetical protein
VLSAAYTRARLLGQDAVAQDRGRAVDSLQCATSVLERKVATGDLKSEASKEKWSYTLEKLIEGVKGVPGFGPFFIDQIRHSDVIEWRAGIGRLVTEGTYTPNYMNDWLAIFRVVMKAGVAEFELERNSMLGIANFDNVTLRPLRRSGPTPDFLPEERLLLVRRSHTRGQVVMDMTKTKRDQTIRLPPAVVRVLR